MSEVGRHYGHIQHKLNVYSVHIQQHCGLKYLGKNAEKVYTGQIGSNRRSLYTLHGQLSSGGQLRPNEALEVLFIAGTN